MMNTLAPRALTILAAAVLTACTLAPPYQRPEAPSSAAFKEASGWVPAVPADALDRGDWWRLFNDPALNELAPQVQVSNQNIAAATAAYAQARALVAEQRAAGFPAVDAQIGSTRSGAREAGSTTTVHRATIGASWEPDVFGRLRAGLQAARAQLDASAADLASATLAAQGELALNVLSLRAADAQRVLIDGTVAAFERSAAIARNRYNAGIAPKADVLQAQTQLDNARADRHSVMQQRTQLEHAIAVLVGQAPANFSLAALPQGSAAAPSVPVGVPSELLQRRPDVAAAERQVASANAAIDVARAGYFPSLTLSASGGASAARIGDLFKASAGVWSIGIAAAQTVFDAGATHARVESARAGYDEAVARYRQTVLTAFAAVEDQLAAARELEQQERLRRSASAAADEAEQLILNQYRAGQVGYSEVVAAQAQALSSRRSLVSVTANRQTAAVALIQSLGGGWHAP